MKFVWRYFALMIGLCLSGSVFGQYATQYSLYMHERYGFNPAFGGMERSLSASLLYRSQWQGLDGNPETRMMNVHMPFYLWQGAIGFQLANETLGAEQQTSFMLSYNYIYESTAGLISTGIRTGIYQKSLDGTKLRSPDGDYSNSIIDHHDINLPNGLVSGISPVVEAGVYFAGDYFEAGVSMTGFFPAGVTLGDNINYNPKPGFHFFGEYFMESFNQVSLYPTVYVKTDMTQLQAEVSLRADWMNNATASLGYRGFGNNSIDAVILSVGVRLSPKFFLHYAYDIGLSSLQTANEGTHEILISYNLGKRIGAGLPPRIIYNPRNL